MFELRQCALALEAAPDARFCFVVAGSDESLEFFVLETMHHTFAALVNVDGFAKRQDVFEVSRSCQQRRAPSACFPGHHSCCD